MGVEEEVEEGAGVVVVSGGVEEVVVVSEEVAVVVTEVVVVVVLEVVVVASEEILVVASEEGVAVDSEASVPNSIIRHNNFFWKKIKVQSDYNSYTFFSQLILSDCFIHKIICMCSRMYCSQASHK